MLNNQQWHNDQEQILHRLVERGFFAREDLIVPDDAAAQLIERWRIESSFQRMKWKEETTQTLDAAFAFYMRSFYLKQLMQDATILAGGPFIEAAFDATVLGEGEYPPQLRVIENNEKEAKLILDLYQAHVTKGVLATLTESLGGEQEALSLMSQQIRVMVQIFEKTYGSMHDIKPQPRNMPQHLRTPQNIASKIASGVEDVLGELQELQVIYR